MFPAYTAASSVRALDLARRFDVDLRGILTWSFEFEPAPLTSQESHCFGSYRVLSTQGIDKPVLNMLRMFFFFFLHTCRVVGGVGYTPNPARSFP